ncbi:fimbrial protein [Enterobacter bugandensis]|nr:fimbrial protein [Enterobacter bugandensis]
MLRKKSKLTLRQLAFISFIVGLNLPVSTAQSSEVEVTFSGTLFYPPPCTISSVVNVELGDVIFDSTSASFINLPVSFNCASAGKNQLTYAIRGEAMGGDQQYVIKTSIENLGVTFLDESNTDEVDNGRVNIRKTYNFDKDSVPTIQVGAFHFKAVPVDRKPIPGAFTAIATLEIGYQ